MNTEVTLDKAHEMLYAIGDLLDSFEATEGEALSATAMMLSILAYKYGVPKEWFLENMAREYDLAQEALKEEGEDE